jgi:hypothetical protein
MGGMFYDATKFNQDYVHGIISYQVPLHLLMIITQLFLTVLVVPTKQYLTYK